MQLFVVSNPKTGAVFVFDNHAAALKCRVDQKLDQDHLVGCSLYWDWRDGQPHRRENAFVSPKPST